MTEVRRVDVKSGDITGTLFQPVGEASGRIIVLPGSEGGTPEHTASLLAADTGTACLALRYFGRGTQRRRLVEVPIEIVDAGAVWLAEHADTKGGDQPTGIFGASKGAELALVVASELPHRFGPIAAIAPSCVAWAGVEFLAPDRRLVAGIFGTASKRSSWTKEGRPIAFIHHPPGVMPRITRHGISVSRSFERALDQRTSDIGSIAIENANGPVLLISGGRDRMWPSTRMAAALLERAQNAGRPDLVEHLCFPEAGHTLGPQSPATGAQRLSFVLDYGGHPHANNAAREVAWARITAFFRNAYTSSES